MGAGDAGAQVLNDIMRNPQLGLQVVGLVDDDPRNLGRALHGVTVLGGRSAIPALAAKLEVDEVLLAIPSATSGTVRDVAAACEEAGVSLRVLPSVRETVGGRVTARDLRDLQIEDLLGRQQVETDLASVRRLLHGRRVLITGAGGSIGSEIARQVRGFQPATLIAAGQRRDPPARPAGHARRRPHRSPSWRTCGTGSGCSRSSASTARRWCSTRRRTSTCRSWRSTRRRRSARTSWARRTWSRRRRSRGAERFVLISTDKAVRPSSVMGGSKRMAEQIVRGHPGTRDGAVRGAVRQRAGEPRLGRSRRSSRQIAAGGPVTVTDPEMTRYFMSVEEAVQLVLQAAALARGGEVFTLDMGEPVNILELAEPVDQVVGPRPGPRHRGAADRPSPR